MLMTLYSTGMRRSELVRLRVEDIDSERMVVHIRQGKGGKDRDVPLCPTLLETLREYWRWKKPKTWLFPRGNARAATTHLTDKAVWYACAEAARHAGLKKRVTPAHAPAQFRHAPAGGWRRSAHHPDPARTRRPGDHQHLPASVAAAPGDDGQSARAPVDLRRLRTSRAITARDKNEPAHRGGGRHPPRAGQPLPGQVSRTGFDFQQLKAFRAIQRCRTAALGGHIDACPRCGYQAAISYNSCRNRHCPKCQTQARERWLAARERELLPTDYFHVVFTVPHELNVLALDNQRLFYDLLFTRQRANPAGSGGRPETPGRRDRPDQHPAHLGTEPAAASAYSLCHPGGRALAGSQPLGAPTVSFLSARQGPEPRVSRQVLRRLEAPLSPQETPLRGAGIRSWRCETVSPTPAALASARLGGLCQACLRRSHRRSCVIWAATRIGSPFPIIGCSPSMANASPSAGRTTPTAASSGR